jgi:hypothetical protein
VHFTERMRQRDVLDLEGDLDSDHASPRPVVLNMGEHDARNGTTTFTKSWPIELAPPGS